MNLPRYAANISHLFLELPFFDRFEAAASAGFEAVEVESPYDQPAKDIQRALLRNGLQMAEISAPPPNYTGGERGYAAVEGREGRFQYDIRRAFRYAAALKTKFLHIYSGVASGVEAKERLIENLKWASRAAPKDLMLTIEPINEGEVPGYFLNNYELAAEVLEAVGAPNVGLQFDSFHAQVITGDATATFEKYRNLIKYIQIGDAPHRTAPGSGDVDFPSLFKGIEASGYTGWLSAEYGTKARTEETLQWMIRK